MLENLLDTFGEEAPLLAASFQLGLAFGGDGVGFALAAFADEFGSAFEPAGFFHFRQMRVEPPAGGLEYPSGQVSEFLPNLVPVYCAATLKKPQNQQIHMPLQHLTVQALFFISVNISLSDISINPKKKGGAGDGESVESLCGFGEDCTDSAACPDIAFGDGGRSRTTSYFSEVWKLSSISYPRLSVFICG